MNHDDFDLFTQGFFEAALWSSTDNADDSGGAPLDDRFGVEHIDETCALGLAQECADFQRDNEADLLEIEPTQAGHDFWLTRNHHGAGFWDRGYPKDIADRLTVAAHAAGSVDLYVSADETTVLASGYERGPAPPLKPFRATLPRPFKPFYVDVSSKYGAPMGRRSDPAEAFDGAENVLLERVPFVDGDYDPGGAYWGSPDDVYCAWVGDLVRYVRATHLSAAKAQFPSTVGWA